MNLHPPPTPFHLHKDNLQLLSTIDEVKNDNVVLRIQFYQSDF